VRGSVIAYPTCAGRGRAITRTRDDALQKGPAAPERQHFGTQLSSSGSASNARTECPIGDAELQFCANRDSSVAIR